MMRVARIRVGDRVMVREGCSGPVFLGVPATIIRLHSWDSVDLVFDCCAQQHLAENDQCDNHHWLSRPSTWSIEQLRPLSPLEDLARCAE